MEGKPSDCPVIQRRWMRAASLRRGGRSPRGVGVKTSPLLLLVRGRNFGLCMPPPDAAPEPGPLRCPPLKGRVNPRVWPQRRSDADVGCSVGGAASARCESSKWSAVLDTRRCAAGSDDLIAGAVRSRPCRAPSAQGHGTLTVSRGKGTLRRRVPYSADGHTARAARCLGRLKYVASVPTRGASPR